MTIQISLCICTVLSFIIVHIKTLHPWLSNVASEDSDETVQADLNLYWVYMSDVLTQIYIVIIFET